MPILIFMIALLEGDVAVTFFWNFAELFQFDVHYGPRNIIRPAD
jgi:hypothetical protein